MIRKNTLLFIKAPYSVASAILVAGLMMYVFTLISNYPLLRGNYGQVGFVAEVTAQILLSVLFGVFV